MNAHELKARILARDDESRFFDRQTMRFFRDTMRNFGVRRITVSGYSETVNPETGRYEMVQIDAWELYRRRPVKHGLQSSHYFRADNFAQIHVVNK